MASVRRFTAGLKDNPGLLHLQDVSLSPLAELTSLKTLNLSASDIGNMDTEKVMKMVTYHPQMRRLAYVVWTWGLYNIQSLTPQTGLDKTMMTCRRLYLDIP